LILHVVLIKPYRDLYFFYFTVLIVKKVLLFVAVTLSQDSS